MVVKTFILITALSAEPFLTVNMSQITIDLLDAVKVQFLKQIFEDDFRTWDEGVAYQNRVE